MSAYDFARNIHKVFPTGPLSPDEVNTIRIAALYADFIVSNAARVTQPNGHTLHVRVMTREFEMLQLAEQLHRLGTCYEAIRLENNVSGMDYVEFYISEHSFKYPPIEGIFRPDPHSDKKWKSSPDRKDSVLLRKILYFLQAYLCLEDSHPAAIMWFGDNLYVDEWYGPHLLSIQNFIYRCAKFLDKGMI